MGDLIDVHDLNEVYEITIVNSEIFFE